MADSNPWLIDIPNGDRLTQVQAEGSEVVLPEGYTWTWCLDARHEPYDELDIPTILERASNVRKRYVLVNSSQLSVPQSEEGEDDASDGHDTEEE